jgi:hypothetical protein
MCFPLHTTHRLQPLNVSFQPVLAYPDGTRKRLQLHPGRVVTIKQVARLYGAAFMKAASVETAVPKHWIFPLNPNIFQNWIFQPSETADLPLAESLLTLHIWL